MIRIILLLAALMVPIAARAGIAIPECRRAPNCSF
jgi:hypothetical protein